MVRKGDKMKLPNWIEPIETYNPIFGRKRNQSMPDEQIYEFLGNNPFEEWSINENLDANTQTIGHIVNSSMALALQHVSISAWIDGITIHNIQDYGSARISWSDLVDDAMNCFDPSIDEEDKDILLNMAKEFMSLAEKMQSKAEGKL
tara:strand:- start:1378 stop:1818 length:441 start_codon:yes stop_codon:yes gene_type:complete